MLTKTNGNFGFRRSMQQASALSWLLCLMTVLCSVVGGADEGKKPDPRIVERDRLWQQAQQLVADEKSAEAIEVGEQVLKIEQTVFGNLHAELTGTLNWLSQQNLASQKMKQAVDYASQYHSVIEKLYGKDDWQTVSARWREDYVRKLQAAPVDTVKQMLAIEARYSELYGAGKYADAATEIEKLIPYESEVLGAQHPFLAKTWTNLANCQMEQRKYSEAEIPARNAFDIYRLQFGLKDPDTAVSAWTLAQTYLRRNQHESALEPLKVAASARRAAGDRLRAALLDSWRGDSLKALGRNEEAAAAWEAALAAFSDLDSFDNQEWQLRQLAGHYEEQAFWNSAVQKRVQLAAIHEAKYGAEDWRTVNAELDAKDAVTFSGFSAEDLKMLADARELARDGMEAFEAGRLEDAISFYSNASRALRRIVGEEHRNWMSVASNLAHVHRSAGNFVESASLFERSLSIEMKVLGEDHPMTASTMNGQAGLYRLIGDFPKAEQLYVRCLRIREKTNGKGSSVYATTLEDLAGLHWNLGEFGKAEELILKCLEIRKAINGDRDAAYATTLSSLAGIYKQAGNFAEAEQLYVQCRQILADVGGVNHPSYAYNLTGLANLCLSSERYSEAQLLYGDCAKILRQTLGEQHPDYAAALCNLALVYETTGDIVQAESLNAEALHLTRSHLEDASMILSERQQLAMNQMLRYRLDSYLSLALDHREFQARAAREVLQWKGATLLRQRAMRLAAEEPGISERFKELQQVSRQLASLSRATPSGDPADWKQRITDLTTDKERLEAQLSRDSATFRSAMQQMTPDQIQAAIPEDAVLIDFLQFSRSRPAEKKGQWDSTTSLLAVIVQRNGDPQLIELGAIAPLSESIDTWRQTFGMSPQGKQAGLTIRQQIWEPLLEHIADAKTVLVSTDGVLGRLPLAALPGKEPGKYLIEDHHLAMIPVPQLLPALVNDLGTKALSRELLLLGDVDYDAESAAPEAPKRKKRRPGKSENRADLIDSLFQPLSGAAGEIAAIQVLYSDLFEAEETDVYTLKRTAATKAAFREVAGQFRHLHLATHGFFASADHLSAMAESTIQSTADRAQLVTRDASVVGWNPGLLSGLALSGANLEPEPGKDDGILTAQEIAFLPLNGVDTVVLSACETGLGELAGGEGLIGIQRAFQVSGARTTVASFWKVHDLVTRRLMERFYRNLWEKEMPRLDALREAQLYILNNPESIRGAKVDDQETTERVPPYYWAAFQLSGDWR